MISISGVSDDDDRAFKFCAPSATRKKLGRYTLSVDWKSISAASRVCKTDLGEAGHVTHWCKASKKKKDLFFHRHYHIAFQNHNLIRFARFHKVRVIRQETSMSSSSSSSQKPRRKVLRRQLNTVFVCLTLMPPPPPWSRRKFVDFRRTTTTSSTTTSSTLNPRSMANRQKLTHLFPPSQITGLISQLWRKKEEEEE